MTFGLAIGLDRNSSEEKTAQPLQIKSVLNDIDATIGQTATKINSLKALITIHEYADLEKFYKQCAAKAPNIVAKYADGGLRRIVMILARDEDAGAPANVIAQEILNTILNDQTVTPSALLYITKEIYDALPYQDRDNYQAQLDVGGIKVHRRYGENCHDCFVVSTIGKPDSPIRKRADLVFERFIKPACDPIDFRPKRSDMKVIEKITDEMYRALRVSPSVVAYIGSYPWNANVMLELGFRINTNKTTVILKDAPRGQADSEINDLLPFDIKDYNYIDIPVDVNDLSFDEHISIVKRIRDFVGPTSVSSWKYNYPAAVYEVAQGKVKIVETNGDLDVLFDTRNLLDRDVRDILESVYAKMPEKQALKIKSEQAQLIGLIVMGTYDNIYASVPFYFDKHPKYNGRAFLPVIDSFATPVDGALRLRVTYFEVTGAIKLHPEGYYYCELSRLPDPPVKSGSVVVPLNAAAGP